MFLNVDNKTLIKSSTYFSVIIASIILIIKAFGWIATDSQSLLASFVDSMLDISSSIMNVIAARVALEPPDDNHRFGHEKFQDLAVFSQGMFFLASSLFTLFSSARVLMMRSEIANGELGVGAMYICLALTAILVSYQTYVVKRTASTLVAADKLHYFSDLLTSLVVIISIKLSGDFWYLDPLFGILISLYIIYGSYRLFRISVKNLVDEEFSDKEREKVLQVIALHGQIHGIHDLKTRKAANKVFIQFHIEMDGKMSLNEAHSLSERVLNDLLRIFPGADIIIHQDPYGIEERVEYRERTRVL